MTKNTFNLLGAVSGFVAVALGAFGAHGLKSTLPEARLAIFETGVRYQMYHALALLAVGLLFGREATSILKASGWFFVAGTVLFSGSLYALALTGMGKLGAITPLGGLAFLAGWAMLAWAANDAAGMRA